MRTEWIVRWRGLEERLPSPQDAMDRLEQLDARGIEAELVEVADGVRRERERRGEGWPAGGRPAQPAAG